MAFTNNGLKQRITLAELAADKKLPVKYLAGLGVKDCPGSGVNIAYYDPGGTLLAYKLRTSLIAKKGSYWPKGKSLLAYGMNRLDKAYKQGYLILVEGESDCWALWNHDFPALGVPGAQTVKATLKAEFFSSLQGVYIHREPDESGQRFLQAAFEFLQEIHFPGPVFEVVCPDGIKDPADLHCHDPKLFTASFALAIKEAKVLKDGNKPAEEPARKVASSQGDFLLELGMTPEYFHAGDGRAFATVSLDGNGRTDTLLVRGREFKSWLSREYYRATGKAPSTKSVQDALAVFEARGRYDGPEIEVSCRFAGKGDEIALDLCDAACNTVLVNAQGWVVNGKHSFRFRRAPAMKALPMPEAGGSMTELQKLVNIEGKDWPLLAGWLLGACNPLGPYPILCLHGPQGSAKSTTARLCRNLIDPNYAPLRSIPHDERDLMIAAGNSWVLAYDNISRLEPWVGDVFCRLATGGGLGVRQLYSDADESIFDARRPILLNGIEDLANQGDLIDRAIVLQCPSIPSERRRYEEQLNKDYEVALPRLLGALLDAVSAAIRRRKIISQRRPTRLADFGLWAGAGELAMGCQPGEFLAAFEGNRGEANHLVLDSSPIYRHLRNLLAGCGQRWIGHPDELLTALLDEAGCNRDHIPRDWPKTARGLAGLLKRLQPFLEVVGIKMEYHRDHERWITLRGERVEGQPSQPSQPSQSRQGVPAAIGDSGPYGKGSGGF